MAQPTAQYEALQYQNTRDVDFGGIALEGAAMYKQFQDEERKRQKEKEDFQMKVMELNPEVVHANFDNSGLQNVDAYSAKVAELIKGQMQIANAQYEKDGDRMKYYSTVAALKGEAVGYTNHLESIVKYGNKLIDLGDDASAVMSNNAIRIDGVFKNGVPGIDPKTNRLINTSSVDGKLDQFNWGEAHALTQVMKKQDKFGVATSTVKMFGEDSKYIDKNGKFVLSTLLDRKGEMNDSAKQLLRNETSSLNQSELIDLASQFDDTSALIKYGSDGRIINRDEVVNAVAKHQESYALSLLQEQQKEDDVVYEKLRQANSRLALQWKQDSRVDDESTYDVAYFDKASANARGVVDPFYEMTFKKPKALKGITGGIGFDIPVPRDMKVMGEPLAVALRKSESGKAQLMTQLNVRKERDLSGMDEMEKRALDDEERYYIEPIFRVVDLTRTQENMVRSQTGISKMISDPIPNRSKKEEKKETTSTSGSISISLSGTTGDSLNLFTNE